MYTFAGNSIENGNGVYAHFLFPLQTMIKMEQTLDDEMEPKRATLLPSQSSKCPIDSAACSHPRRYHCR